MSEIIKLPKMIGLFIDNAKQQEMTLFSAMNKLKEDEILNTWFKDHQDDFAKAWFLGYEIEEVSEQDLKLLNDIIDFAIQFEFGDYETYHDLDDDLIVENTRKDIQKLRTLLNYTLGR